jgi:hypothetical protein
VGSKKQYMNEDVVAVEEEEEEREFSELVQSIHEGI